MKPDSQPTPDLQPKPATDDLHDPDLQGLYLHGDVLAKLRKEQTRRDSEETKVRAQRMQEWGDVLKWLNKARAATQKFDEKTNTYVSTQPMRDAWLRLPAGGPPLERLREFAAATMEKYPSLFHGFRVREGCTEHFFGDRRVLLNDKGRPENANSVRAKMAALAPGESIPMPGIKLATLRSTLYAHRADLPGVYVVPGTDVHHVRRAADGELAPRTRRIVGLREHLENLEPGEQYLAPGHLMSSARVMASNLQADYPGRKYHVTAGTNGAPLITRWDGKQKPPRAGSDKPPTNAHQERLFKALGDQVPGVSLRVRLGNNYTRQDVEAAVQRVRDARPDRKWTLDAQGDLIEIQCKAASGVDFE